MSQPSSVEPDNEAVIVAALDRLMAGRTTVLTSHRPSLVGQADVAYVIEDGRVTDAGPPLELMGRNVWFARFIAIQRRRDGVVCMWYNPRIMTLRAIENAARKLSAQRKEPARRHPAVVVGQR